MSSIKCVWIQLFWWCCVSGNVLCLLKFVFWWGAHCWVFSGWFDIIKDIQCSENKNHCSLLGANLKFICLSKELLGKVDQIAVWFSRLLSVCVHLLCHIWYLYWDLLFFMYIVRWGSRSPEANNSSRHTPVYWYLIKVMCMLNSWDVLRLIPLYRLIFLPLFSAFLAW